MAHRKKTMAHRKKTMKHKKSHRTARRTRARRGGNDWIGRQPWFAY